MLPLWRRLLYIALFCAVGLGINWYVMTYHEPSNTAIVHFFMFIIFVVGQWFGATARAQGIIKFFGHFD